MAVFGVYDITLGGFLLVAVVALTLMWTSRRDRKRSIRFGFFLEHDREGEEVDEPTEDLWPGEEKSDGEGKTRDGL